ncbi:MAG TPA: response regulator transcription factor [Phycisphaerae bacterium]|nr:response regulator transcription factor [Actinomycetota bacterium]HRX86631.1 response regulator transcription factor [Phycisphaerae bacterium]
MVVEDEPDLASVIAAYLRGETFDVDIAGTGPQAVTMAKDLRPDLVVLDIMLPGFDGLEVCRQLRTFTDCYVIMLTARDDEIDKVIGLSVGADDYLVKPFSPRELTARIRAMLRRPRTIGQDSTGQHARLFGPMRLDPDARKVWLDDVELELTRTEFDLLESLTSAPKRAFTRRQLIDAVWGSDWYGDEHIVDVHVGHLRKKLEDDAAAPRFIRTVRGVGYGMVS